MRLMNLQKNILFMHSTGKMYSEYGHAVYEEATDYHERMLEFF